MILPKNLLLMGLDLDLIWTFLCKYAVCRVFDVLVMGEWQESAIPHIHFRPKSKLLLCHPGYVLQTGST